MTKIINWKNFLFLNRTKKRNVKKQSHKLRGKMKTPTLKERKVSQIEKGLRRKTAKKIVYLEAVKEISRVY